MTDDLNRGVPLNEGWRFVQVTDPTLNENLEKAREDCRQKEKPWQEATAQYQIGANVKRRRLESPYGKALREAEAAVTGRLNALLDAGRIVEAGYLDGQLDGDPVKLPSDLPQRRGDRPGTVNIRGKNFHEVRLYWADAL